MKVTATYEISDERIADVLVGAFEGGSNYWIRSISQTPYEWAPGTEGQVPRPLALRLPVTVTTDDEGGGESNDRVFDRSALERGLQLMATKHLTQFREIVEENDDANTADVLLQLSLFGEILFD